MNKRAIILVGDPNFSWSNENSAVVKYLHQIRDVLIAANWDVELFPLPANGGYESKPLPSKRSMGSRIRKLIKSLSPIIYQSFAFRRYKIEQTSLLHSAINQLKPADLIIELLVYGSDIGCQLKNKWNCKLISIYDSPLEEQFIEMHKTSVFQIKQIGVNEKKSIANSDLVICYSNSVAQYLLKRYTVSNVKVLPCIVWKGPIKRDQNSNRISIGFIGSFLSWHKVEILLRAFEHIAPKYPNCDLVLVGYGQDWTRIKGLSEHSVFKDRIQMTGFVSEEELIKIKSELTIAVMPGSNWYGSPLKLFEYAEAGIPFISPSTKTVKDLFHDEIETFFIDPENEIFDLAEKLSRLIENEDLRNQLSANGIQAMKNRFEKTMVLNNFVNYSNELTNG